MGFLTLLDGEGKIKEVFSMDSEAQRGRRI